MKKNKHHIPETFQDLDKWDTNRRMFLRAAMVAGAASQIAWFTSCSAEELEEANEHLNAEQATILKKIVNVIWPEDGNGPSAEDLNTYGYLIWVLGDTRWNPDEPEYIVEGIDWANETAYDIYEEKFVDLTEEQQETFIHTMTEMDFGKNWISVIVTLVLESVLLDPIYGGNVGEKGWKWLEHVPGQPRPDDGTRVEAILEKYKPNDI